MYFILSFAELSGWNAKGHLRFSNQVFRGDRPAGFPTILPQFFYDSSLEKSLLTD